MKVTTGIDIIEVQRIKEDLHRKGNCILQQV